MHVTLKWLVFLSVFALLSGCAGVPSLAPGLRVSVAYLVDRLQCEFHQALVAQGPRIRKIKNWHAGYELTLQVDEEGSLALDSSWINPVTGGTFTLGIGGGVTRSASRLVSLKFTLPVKKLLHTGCDTRLPPASGFELDSNLGLTDWLTRVLDAAESNSFENFDSFGTNIQFKLTLSGKLTPTWELAAFKGPGGVTGERSDTHKINIAFEAPDPNKSAGSRLEIDRSLQRQDLQLLLPRTFRLR